MVVIKLPIDSLTEFRKKLMAQADTGYITENNTKPVSDGDSELAKFRKNLIQQSQPEQPNQVVEENQSSIQPLKRNLLQNVLGLGPAATISNTAQSLGQNLSSGWNSANAGLSQLGETLTGLEAKNNPIPFIRNAAANLNEKARQGKEFYRNLATEQQQTAEAAPNLPETVKVLGPSLQQLPTMGVSALAGPGAPAVFGAISGGQYMEEAANEGATPEQQFAYGTIMGTVEGLTEKIPLGNAQKLFGSAGKKALLTYLKNIPDEFIQEATSEIAGGISKQAIYKPDQFITDGKVDFDKIADLGKRSLEAGGQGAVTGALMGGPGLVSAGANTARNNQNVRQQVSQDGTMTNQQAQNQPGVLPENQAQVEGVNPPGPVEQPIQMVDLNQVGQAGKINEPSQNEAIYSEAKKYNSPDDFINSQGFFRKTNSGSAFKDVDYAMFSNDRQDVEHYGQNLFVPDFSSKFKYEDVNSLKQEFKNRLLENPSLLESYQQGKVDEMGKQFTTI